MPTVVLLRHGRTAANSSGVLAGWTPDVGLDEAGRKQADEAARRLASVPLARIVASPLQRCQETAAALLPREGRTVRTEDDLGECHYGAWTGRKISELASDPLWRTVQDQPSAVVFPPSPEYSHESLAGMQARAVGALRRIDAEVAAEHGERAVWVAVSHGDVIKALLADALGQHLDLFQRISVGPASISVVRYTARRPFVLRIGDRGGVLDDLVPPEPAEGQQSGDAVPGGETGATTGGGTAGAAARASATPAD